MNRAGRWAFLLIASGLSLLAGALAAVAHPPWSIWPGLVGYPLLIAIVDRSRTVRGAVWYGWLAGFAYFFIGCWWVAEAFLVNPEQAWMAPFAASLLPAGLSLFWAAACGLYRRFRADRPTRILLFVALFALFEWLRGHILTGLPWNVLGASWTAGSAPSQVASWVGVYGLGLVTLLGVAPLALLISRAERRRGLIWTGAGALVITALFGVGAMRLAGAQVGQTDTLVRLVQPDIAQSAKWEPEAFRAVVERYVALTESPGAQGAPDVVIWPEGALPITANEAFSSWVGESMAGSVSTGQTLIAGFSRGEPGETPDDDRYFNSLFVLRDEGDGLRIASVYDKNRLVPFGEYLPLGELMTAVGLRSLVHVPADFSPGPRPAPIDIPGAPRAQPLICYEGLYPGLAETAGPRPGWIVNASNDAWFGVTSGPLQHLNLASYRSIESGLPMARATPTGVSAMIDPYGRVIESLPAGRSGVLDVRLPRPAPPTLYSRTGDFWFALVLAGLLLAFSASGRRFPIFSRDSDA